MDELSRIRQEYCACGQPLLAAKALDGETLECKVCLRCWREEGREVVYAGRYHATLEPAKSKRDGLPAMPLTQAEAAAFDEFFAGLDREREGAQEGVDISRGAFLANPAGALDMAERFGAVRVLGEDGKLRMTLSCSRSESA